jgi:sensor domain CHASE-containing protein
MGLQEALVALVVAVVTLLTALVEKSRRENKDDHNRVRDSLNRIETKIDGHINDHAKGEFDD